MQLIHLQYFCTVARCRNMSRAADELWISQSALSKAIGNLEEELGAKLFDRVGRGIQLNESGRLFYHQVSHVLLLLSDAVRQVRSIQVNSPHDVSVLFTAATFIAPRLREDFAQAHPEINLEMKCSYSPEASDLQHCDFFIFATPASNCNMECTKLMEEEMVLACNTKHPLADRKEINLIETEDYFYQCLPPQESMHENLTSSCQKAGFEPKIGFCTEDSYAFFSGLGSSTLLTMIPAFTAFTALCENLVTIRIKEPECKRTIYIAQHPNKEINENCQIFKKFCIEYFKNIT